MGHHGAFFHLRRSIFRPRLWQRQRAGDTLVPFVVCQEIFAVRPESLSAGRFRLDVVLVSDQITGQAMGLITRPVITV